MSGGAEYDCFGSERRGHGLEYTRGGSGRLFCPPVQPNRPPVQPTCPIGHSDCPAARLKWPVRRVDGEVVRITRAIGQLVWPVARVVRMIGQVMWPLLSTAHAIAALRESLLVFLFGHLAFDHLAPWSPPMAERRFPRPDAAFAAYMNNYYAAAEKFWSVQWFDESELEPLKEALSV